MSDQMPMFDDPIPPAESNPKKPRQKPVRRRKAVKAEAPKPVKKRRKKRKISKHPALAAPYKASPKHAGGRYSKDVYATIVKLMGMNNAERSDVLDIVKGLTNGRAD
jgi:hypothetical protein